MYKILHVMIIVSLSQPLSAFAENTGACPSPTPRPAPKVGMEVWVDHHNGTIAEVYLNGKFKVEFYWNHGIYGLEDVQFSLPCLNDLHVNDTTFIKDNDGKFHYLGTVDHIWDNGIVDAGRGAKGRTHKYVPIETIYKPLAVDPETGLKPGDHGLFKNEIVKIDRLFSGGVAIISLNCGFFFCDHLQISTAEFSKAL